MAETSKNKIYYNDNENSVADVLADMKKMAESTDEAIEKSKYNDAAIKKSISDVEKKQVEKNTEQDSKIVELQTEKAKLETELKEMQEDFYQNSIRGQVSGEYIHVEDSSNCRARIGIGGNHEQETSTQGKNYFTGNKIDVGTNLGVTYSFDNSILRLNGTSTGVGTVLGDISTKVVLPAGNYKFRASLYSGSFEKNSKDIALYLRSKDGYISGNYATSGITLTQLNNITAFTLTESTELYLRIFVNGDGLVFNNTQLAILLVKVENDEDIGTFEQFVPNMPSPDYPSPIKTVGSNVNLFNKDNYIKSKLYINKNENKFSEASMGKSFIFDISKYNKLTISKVSSERFGVFASVDYPQKDGVGTYLQDAATNTTSFTYDFTEFNYLVVMYYLTSDTITEQQILDSIKIVEGTEIGEYSKYGQGSVKVTKCNKNLYDKNTTTDGKYIGGNGSIQTQSNIMHSDYIQIKTNINYYITGRSDLSRVALYDKNKTFLEITSTTQPNGVLNITNSNCKYIIINALLTNKDTLQIEEKTATAYEEHQEQSYIMPVQKEILEDDYFDWDNEEEVHTWNKLVLNGTEEFNSWTGNAPSGYKVFYLKILTNDINPQGDLKCNTFKYMENPWESGKNAIGLQRVFKEVYISIESKYASTLEEFKAYLKSQYDAGTPVVVYYKLAKPTRLKFTDEQKVVAKELNNARTYKNVTNITTDSKAILSLDYAKDQETQNQKMQNEIDEIKQLLSTTQTSALLLDNMQTDIESEVE